MTDTTKTDREAQEAADAIKRNEASEQRPRGGVQDREDDERQHEVPPPLSH